MIWLKSTRELELMKAASSIVAEVIQALTEYVRPGVTTQEIDEKARTLIIERGGRPAFKGYRGFPGDICISINEEVVHGIPGPRRLKEGDIVSLDIGVELDRYFGDGTVTLPVGRISKEAKRLLKVTRNALRIGIEQARPGNRLSNLSWAIQSYVEKNGYSVVRQFVGHGIGKNMHEEPAVPNFGLPDRGPRLKPGMVLAIEPMVNQGGIEVKVLSDGWTAVTCDGKLSAHFEHTVAITESGPEVLTRCRKKNL